MENSIYVRSITFLEALRLYCQANVGQTLHISPKAWKGSKDSTIPTGGRYSFWFKPDDDGNVPVLEDGLAVTAKFCPELEGRMQVHVESDGYGLAGALARMQAQSYNELEGVYAYSHSIPEYVTSQPVEIDQFYVQSWLIKTLRNKKEYYDTYPEELFSDLGFNDSIGYSAWGRKHASEFINWLLVHELPDELYWKYNRALSSF